MASEKIGFEIRAKELITMAQQNGGDISVRTYAKASGKGETYVKQLVDRLKEEYNHVYSRFSIRANQLDARAAETEDDKVRKALETKAADLREKADKARVFADSIRAVDVAGGKRKTEDERADFLAELIG